MSLRTALLRCFQDHPQRVFGIQDLCEAVEEYYELTSFQRQLDPRYPQPRYHHQVRRRVKDLVVQEYVVRLGRNRLNANLETTPLL